MLRLSLSLLVTAAAAMLPCPPAAAIPETSRARYLMGTVCQGIAYGEGSAAALDAAFDEIARLESILSDYRADSELSRLNREAFSGPFACSLELFEMIAAAAGLSDLTGGAFDITVAPLIEIWDLRGTGRRPSGPELTRALQRVGSSLLQLDAAGRTVRFRAEGMTLDPGAIGKGFALDAAARVLRARGVTSALLDFGGQVLALGAPPGGDAWEVAIAHPRRRDTAALTLRLRDESASTSGSSERHVMADGREVGHIIDPRNGQPSVANGSVTVTAPSATAADALSTALLVLGPEEGLRWVESRPGISAIWLDVGAAGRLRVIRSKTMDGGSR